MKILPDIIGIVGPIRAGKTTTANYLVERYGYTIASNSDILKRILAGMGIIPSRTNLAMLGNSIFEVLGNDVIAKYRLDRLQFGRIVVDGIRYTDELQRYLESPSFKLLGLTADSSIRFERTLKGSEEFKDLEISRSAFDRLTLSRSELDVPELLSRADVIITNLGSVEELRLSVDRILDGWKN
jgi:dephospho-CoA kinase